MKSTFIIFVLTLLIGPLSRALNGEMKVVESWRFEIPYSSAAFSSNPSP